MRRWISSTLILLLAGASFGQTAECGDCNVSTGAPDVTDALYAAQISSGMRMAAGLQPCACDVNASMSITVVDALLIAQRSAGLTVALTCPMAVCGVAGNAPPTVNITSPAAGVGVFGAVRIGFDTGDADGNPLIVTVQYSTNGGATFLLATSTGGGTVTANPTAPAAPAAGQTFHWSSLADSVGIAAPYLVVLRISANDGTSTTSAEVVVRVDQNLTCSPVACAGNAPAAFTTGPAAAPTFFNFGTDSAAFEINTSGRMAGQAVDIFTANLTDDVDLYIANVGIACGDPDPANYQLASVGGGSGGLAQELHALGAADLIARGERVPVVVFHWGTNPTATCLVAANCRAILACTGTFDCASAPLAGSTGTAGATMVPAAFTLGAGGNSAFYSVDFSALPAGGGLELRMVAATSARAQILLLAPDIPCGYENSYAWTGIQSFAPNATDDVLLLTAPLLALYPSGRLPIVIYNVAAGAVHNFTLKATCPTHGPCSGMLGCGQMVSDSTGPGTGAPITQFTFGPAGDSDGWDIDLSGRLPGQSVTVTLESVNDNCELFLSPVGMPCAWPLPWVQGSSLVPGVGPANLDRITVTDSQIGTLTKFAVIVFHPAVVATGDYVLSVSCFTPDCTPLQTINEASSPVPLTRMGNTTGANDTVAMTCGGGDIGGRDDIWVFVPSMTRTYTIHVCTAGYDTMLSVRAGNCVNGTLIGCSDDACGTGGSRSGLGGLPLTAGTSYAIIVDGWGGAFGTYTLDISTP